MATGAMRAIAAAPAFMERELPFPNALGGRAAFFANSVLHALRAHERLKFVPALGAPKFKQWHKQPPILFYSAIL